MRYILIEVLFIISMVFIMAEWVYVLSDMVRENKGTRLVKKLNNIKYSNKADGLINTTIKNGGIAAKHRYIQDINMCR